MLATFGAALAAGDASALETATIASAKLGVLERALSLNTMGHDPDERKLSALLYLWNNRGFWTIPRTLGLNLFLFTDLLRCFAPKYAGPPITLYRGQSLARHQAAEYGVAWTSLIDMARTFARTRETPGTVLRIEAQPEMIVVHLPSWITTVKTNPKNDLEFEDEYILDPKRVIGKVTLIE